VQLLEQHPALGFQELYLLGHLNLALALLDHSLNLLRRLPEEGLPMILYHPASPWASCGGADL